MHLIRDESGISLIELAIAGMLAMIMLAGMSVFMLSSLDSGAFVQGQSVTVDDARLVLQRIENEARGAEQLDWCAPAGSCIVVSFESRPAPHDLRTVRYTHTGEVLNREEFDHDTDTWNAPETVIERVVNGAGQPVFGCDTNSTLLRVLVSLHIEPTPQSDPTYNLQTSFRPRNFPEVATCP